MNFPLIAPSILSADFSHLNEEIISLTSAGADILHLDIMDGHYVPNLTFGYVLIEAISQLTPLPLDAHLMVTNPADYVDRLAAMGISYLSFHPETVFHPHRLIQQIKAAGIKAGIALNPGIPVTNLSELLQDLDYVLLMSVNPGFSGQKFIPAIIDKVHALKALIQDNNPNVLIQVDGGVGLQNYRQLVSAGADILVSASYIFSSPDYATAIRSLKNV